MGSAWKIGAEEFLRNNKKNQNMNKKEIEKVEKLEFIKKALTDDRYLSSISIFVSHLIPKIKVGEKMEIPLKIAGISTIRNNVTSMRNAGYKLELVFDKDVAVITRYENKKK